MRCGLVGARVWLGVWVARSRESASSLGTIVIREDVCPACLRDLVLHCQLWPSALNQPGRDREDLAARQKMFGSLDRSHCVDQLDPHSGSKASRHDLQDEFATAKLKLSGARRGIARIRHLRAASHPEARPKRRCGSHGESPPTRSAVRDRDRCSRRLRRTCGGDLFAAQRLPKRLATVRADRTTDGARTDIDRHLPKCPRSECRVSRVSVAQRADQHSARRLSTPRSGPPIGCRQLVHLHEAAAWQ